MFDYEIQKGESYINAFFRTIRSYFFAFFLMILFQFLYLSSIDIQVSDMAESFPHCGYAMKLSDKTEDKVEIPAEVKEVGKKYDKIILTIKRVRYISIVIVVILMFFHNETGDDQKIFENNIFFICLLLAGVWNAKYVNATSLYRQGQEFQRMGLNIDRSDMAHWTILCAERYLSIFYDYLHQKLYDYHVLQADETPVLVLKENRTDGNKHYMWVYRTGKMYADRQIVLYDYQPSRNASHPRDFLKKFRGVCVTDGYQVYHTLEKERKDLKIAGCWAHARRRFDETVKALSKDKKKSSLAYLALKQIQAIYREDNKLADKSAEERLRHRQMTVKPLVDAYFAWAKQNKQSVPAKSKTANGLTYSLNQEKYLRTFLEDGEVPMDNNAAEQSIRPFCVGKKNWVMIDTVAGAEASAMIYSIAETAKANNLKPYNYFKYLLEEIPRHMDDHGVDFCEDLLPWSDKLPAECRK